MEFFKMMGRTTPNDYKSIVAPLGLNDTTKVDTLLTKHRLAVIFQRRETDLLVWNWENGKLLVSRFIPAQNELISWIR